MGKILDTIVEFFDVEGLSYELAQDTDNLKSGFSRDEPPFGNRVISMLSGGAI